MSWASVVARFAISVIAVALHAGSAPLMAADGCRDRFVSYLTGTPDGPAGVARMTIEMGPTRFENEFLFVSQDHNLYKPVIPSGQPWILVFNGARYQSDDLGKTWSKIQSFDREKARADAREVVRQQAMSAKDVRCGQDLLAGVPHDTFEATMSVPGAGSDLRSRYWVSRETRRTTRTISITNIAGAQMKTIQEWTAAPALILPSPK